MTTINTYVFSGTGNTLLVSQKLKEELLNYNFTCNINKITTGKDIFEEAVDRTRYDSCDNEECDSHTSSGKTKKCPLCGVANDSNAKYCKICGEELDSDRF